MTPERWRPDKRAERILFGAFWTSAGWKPEAERGASEFDAAYARRAGYMFEPVGWSHEEIVRRLIALHARLDRRAVADAFAAGLAARRLDLRSALGSYAATLRLPAHAYAPGPAGCAVCGLSAEPARDLDVLSFERFKWGGVRHADPAYALFDLERFAATEPPARDGDAYATLRAVLDAARALPAEARPADLLKAVRPVLPGNDAERRAALECLGYAGVLQPAARPGFLDGWPGLEREPPDWKSDWAYPLSWWRGRDGVNGEALAHWFPALA